MTQPVPKKKQQDMKSLRLDSVMLFRLDALVKARRKRFSGQGVEVTHSSCIRGLINAAYVTEFPDDPIDDDMNEVTLDALVTAAKKVGA